MALGQLLEVLAEVLGLVGAGEVQQIVGLVLGEGGRGRDGGGRHAEMTCKVAQREGFRVGWEVRLVVAWLRLRFCARVKFGQNSRAWISRQSFVSALLGMVAK